MTTILLCSLLAADLTPDISATFSIVAADPETGVCGAAVASKYPAVGKVVPYVRPGVGAFCTQHYHVPKWGEPAVPGRQPGPGDPVGARHRGRMLPGLLLFPQRPQVVVVLQQMQDRLPALLVYELFQTIETGDFGLVFWRHGR